MTRFQQVVVVAAVLAACLAATAVDAGDFYKDFDVTSGDHVRVADGGKQVFLTLDAKGGSAFQSKNQYRYGEFSVDMKLIPRDSAGTVTSFYLTSGEGDGHEEIDIEFMGNLSGDPCVMNTNVWTKSDGKKEHQFYLWFDPSADFHTYTIIWNPLNIIFMVDKTAVRVFKNHESSGVPYPSKPMTVHATLWNGDYWATRQGAVKINWAHAPFVVSYRNYNVDACVSANGVSSCPQGNGAWMYRQLDAAGLSAVSWAEKNHMTYNYCNDGWRFPRGFPPECSLNN